jgi:hypothetical protein
MPAFWGLENGGKKKNTNLNIKTMKCIHHQTEDAVVTCDFCGAGLCKDCRESSEFNLTRRCEICDRQICNGYEHYSICPSCHENDKNIQVLIKNIEKGGTKKITAVQKKLYLALKALNWEPEMEYEDGHKTVDIAILAANLFIEVNGSQHAENSDQLRRDLWRSHSSLKKGFLTLPVYNMALKDAEFHQIVSAINDIAKERKQALKIEKRDNCS